MKLIKFITLGIVLIFNSGTYGQVATIIDSDGWTNVRQTPDSKGVIIHKLYENEVFMYIDVEDKEAGDWVKVSIPKNKFSLEKWDASYIIGYIHKSRLLILDELEQYKGNAFSFQYQLGPFNAKGRILNDMGDGIITGINGRPVWGQDGGLPKVQVNAIKVNIADKTIQLHPVFFNDIFECTNDFKVYRNKDTYFVHQWNSDGAGGYFIIWVFNKNGLIQRFVSLI